MEYGSRIQAPHQTSLRPIALLLVGFGIIACISNLAIAATNPLLASRQTDSNDLTAFTKWNGIIPRYEAQREGMADKCIAEACLNKQWEQLLIDLKNKPVYQQIESVNRFFNSMRYVSDQENYGISDYWQTPYELMERGGDCEDYAVAKYISLRRLGIPENALRIVIVRDTKLDDTVHAFLEVNIEDTLHILDNQAQSVLPVASVYHYKPMFAINESKWWSYK